MLIHVSLVLTALLMTSCMSTPGRGALVARGQDVFREQGCYGCHTVGAAGTPIAPDLSRIGARLDEASLAAWLRNPALQRPTAHMPKLQLSETEVRALAAYLASQQ
jgi:mono/diheme cytochrome c family protein